MKKNKEKRKIYILYTEKSEKEFLQLSQMTDKYEVFYKFINSEEMVRKILEKNKGKDILSIFSAYCFELINKTQPKR